MLNGKWIKNAVGNDDEHHFYVGFNDKALCGKMKGFFTSWKDQTDYQRCQRCADFWISDKVIIKDTGTVGTVIELRVRKESPYPRYLVHVKHSPLSGEGFWWVNETDLMSYDNIMETS